MEPKDGSISGCNSFTSRTKHLQSIYGFQRSSKHSYCNKNDTIFSKFSCDNIKSGEETDKTYKNNMDESVDEDSEKTEDTLSIVSYNNTINRRDNFFALTNSHKTLTKSAAELSAQIMSVPFEEFNDNTSLAACKTSSYPFDILEKIKEVYKACTCKVCECIVGKSQKNEVCKCKPCECDDCNSLRKRFVKVKSYRSADLTRDGVDRLNKQFIGKLAGKDLRNPQCNCKPCECAECVRSFTTPCDCVVCRTRSNYIRHPKLVVAAVETDNRTHQDCTCEPCNCANCTDHAATSNLRREMSTGVSRPETCRCDTCLSDACSPEGPDACSCEKRRGIRKSLQKDTDYDIRRSIITQKNNSRHANRGQLDLIAMVTAISEMKSAKPVHPSVNGCCCDEYECLFCNIKNSMGTLKSSNGIDGYFFKDDTVDSPYVEPKFVTGKLSPKATKVTQRLESLKRYLEINAFSNFSSDLKYRPCECMNCDLNKTARAESVCECRRCTIKRRVNSFKNNSEKISQPILKQETHIPLNACDKNKYIDDAYESSSKEAHRSLPKKCRTRITNLPMQSLYGKLNTLDTIQNVEPLIGSLNIPRQFNVNESDKIKEHYSDMSDQPIPNYLDGNERRTKKITTPGLRDTNYLTLISNYRTDNLSDKFNVSENRNIKSNNLPLPRNTNDAYNNGTNKLFSKYAAPSRFTNVKKNNSRILCCDGYNFDETEYFQSVNESSQYNKQVSQSKFLISKIKERKPQYCNRAVHNTNSIEKSQYVYGINTEPVENSLNSKTNNTLGLEEDYKRVQSTIKEARSFSLHLKKLLDTYEKANREFENVYYNLSHPNNSLRHVVPQNVLREAKEVTNSQTSSMYENYCKNSSENYNDNVTKKGGVTKESKESNIETLFFDPKKYYSENKLNINIKESIQSLKECIRSTSKHKTNIATEDLEEDKDNVTPKEQKPENSSKENVCNSSYDDDDTFIEFKEDSSSTLSFVDKNNNLKTTLSIFKPNPITETNARSIQMHYSVKKRNEKRNPKKYTKIYKQVAFERRKHKPKYKICSATFASADRIKHNNNSKGNEDDQPVSDVNASATYVVTDDSATTISTNKLANNLNRLPINRYEFKVKHKGDVAITKSPLQTKPSNTKPTISTTIIGRGVMFEAYHFHSQKLIKKRTVAKQATTTWKNNSKTSLQSFERSLDDEKKLRSDVEEKVDSPLLQNSETQCEKNSNDEIINSESLKVESVTVRKVSHRSILVKWQVPKVLNNVEGYEVFINGRSVQKIEDNLCRESVVSSIPRDDKFLLTVRTMTKCGCSGNTIASVICRQKSKEIIYLNM